MTVTEKHADIAILRTLGQAGERDGDLHDPGRAGRTARVARVTGGLLLATHLETIVPVVERAFGIHFLDPSIYFISELPSDPRASDIVRSA